MRHLIPISGKDSLATALVQTARDPSLDYEYFFSDVGMELPETYEWLDMIEREKGWHIHRVGKDLEKTMRGYDVLPSHNWRYCTRECKIEPMVDWIGDDEAIVYYGLRADENRTGFVAKTDNIKPKYPLRELGLDLQGVWAVLDAQDLLPPSFHWNSLYHRVCEVMGVGGRWQDELKPWEEHLLFAGRSRSNCFQCFYQRQYEYVWLYETHPALFRRAAELEERVGGDGYTWREGYRLTELIDRRREIRDRRAKAVVKKIENRLQHDMYEVETGLIDTVSCGLHCGK